MTIRHRTRKLPLSSTSIVAVPLAVSLPELASFVLMKARQALSVCFLPPTKLSQRHIHPQARNKGTWICYWIFCSLYLKVEPTAHFTNRSKKRSRLNDGVFSKFNAGEHKTWRGASQAFRWCVSKLHIFLPVTHHRIIQRDTKYCLPQNRSIKRHSRESDYVFLAENWWNSFYFTCRSNSALCKTKTREVAVTNIVIALTSLRPRPRRFREQKLAAYFSSGWW